MMIQAMTIYPLSSVFADLLSNNRLEGFKMIVKKLPVILSFLLIPSMALAGSWTGNLNLLYGYKYTDRDDWDPVDKQIEFGVSFDLKRSNWPASIALEMLRSQENKYVSDSVTELGTYHTHVEAEINEIALGMRRNIALPHNINVFFGGGVTMIEAEVCYENESFPGGRGGFSVTDQNVESASLSDDDLAYGFWASAGLYTAFAKDLNVGIQARWSKAEVTLFDEGADAGGLHGLLFIGNHW
jgi:opacity protein-like surface antigen